MVFFLKHAVPSWARRPWNSKNKWTQFLLIATYRLVWLLENLKLSPAAVKEETTPGTRLTRPPSVGLPRIYAIRGSSRSHAAISSPCEPMLRTNPPLQAWHQRRMLPHVSPCLGLLAASHHAPSLRGRGGTDCSACGLDDGMGRVAGLLSVSCLRQQLFH